MAGTGIPTATRAVRGSLQCAPFHGRTVMPDRQRTEDSERLRLVRESEDTGFWSWDLKTDLVRMSPFNARIYGIAVPDGPAGEWIVVATREWELHVHPEDRVRLGGIVARTLESGETFTAEFRVRDPDRPERPRWLQSRASLLRDPQDGTPLRFVGLLIDVTTQREVADSLRRSEARLRVSEERLALALDSGEDGLFDWDLSNAEGWVSARWLARLGHRSDHPRPLAALWRSVGKCADRRAILDALRAHLRRDTPLLEVECRQSMADGTLNWTLVRARVVNRDGSGRALRLVGTLIDITGRKTAELRIAYLAMHDTLTNLPNRNQFGRDLDRAVARGHRMPNRVAVLACDLDRFKAVNDALGHRVGDRLLCFVAARLRTMLGRNDAIARLGGDEFAVILGDVAGEAGVAATCQAVIRTLSEPIMLDGAAVDIGISIGAVLLNEDGAGAEEVFKRADTALYQAKAAGRNTFRLFDSGAHARSTARSMIALDMREAIRRRDFFLVYQPIVNLATGAVTNFEALMRWRHPVHGPIPPTEFIPMAEESGLILQLGAWALMEACREAATWPDPVRVAVNVSAVQFGSDLEDKVALALEGSGLSPQRLRLEVTESVLLNNQEQALAALHRLRALGVQIALDDFGTGYSCLGYLRRFPFDALKIDRFFIRDIADPDAAAIVRAVSGIGERLGMGIVAEGVETREQLDLVRRERCTEVQGYLISEPVPAGETLALLSRHHARFITAARALLPVSC